MAVLTLSEDHHNRIGIEIEEALSALEDVETILTNRTIDTNTLKDELEIIANACSNIHKLTEGI